ncbi:ABC transporter ATP-binding protein [uncultured Cohaesibacter sp.]|uniref:ABC transporter ATP-binding protein n=1 Tax=uncultured Cohaesibacter sp. TaxID=1002546 RepID=UPI00292D2086|nr:ABC transporter ATP-binding protein [uncultured Cohaesibacter sp.]
MNNGLQIQNVSKSFGAHQVLKNIDLEIKAGEFLVLLGESGCGKSTLLRLISGLEIDHDGSILIEGKDVTALDPKDRNIAMVFQSYALYPHMSVFDNIAFGMRIRKADKDRIKREVNRVAEVLKLTDYLKRKPGQLSGGQRQRVAIGRAMVRHPQLFLFDEPLSNLDAKLRGEMRTELKRIHKTLNATIAYVTHDQVEAMTLADKIVLLNGGKVEQFGTPEELYMHPDTLFAARFIGSQDINMIHVEIAAGDNGLWGRLGDVSLPLPPSSVRHFVSHGEPAILAVRPEALRLGDHADGYVTRGHTVELCEPMGAETHIVLDFHGTPVRLRANGLVKLQPGELQSITWDLSCAHLFSIDDGRHL